MPQTLRIHPTLYAVCQLPAHSEPPAWAMAGVFWNVTQTLDECSVVCAEVQVPPGIRCERGWRVLEVAGPLDFSLTGVLASLASPLAEAGISIFALSTFDTDYLLVRETALEAAINALRRAGCTLHELG